MIQPPASVKPPHPYAVLTAAIILPGSGQLWLGLAQRALVFLFFILILGWLTAHFAPPTSSFIGRHAGGVFVYALSILDAYKIARLRWEQWKRAQQGETPTPALH